MPASRYFVIPASGHKPEYYAWMTTSDTDLAEGEIVKMTSNEPEAVSADDASDAICGVVNGVKKNAAGSVTEAEIYFGPLLQMPIDASHHVPGIGDPVYASSKSGISADGAGVAANAAAIGRARRIAPDASSWALIACHWPFWADKPADAS